MRTRWRISSRICSPIRHAGHEQGRGATALARGRGPAVPSIILHGGEPAERLALANKIARALLCEAEPDTRPCGRCRHCRRIDIENDGVFHPDFVFVRRDPGKRETVIPVDKVRTLLQTAQVSPFEARGQVFVIVEAEVLHPAGANVLLKTLEEPAYRSPRNFLLLASSASELLPTLRSRSWTVYLGAGATGNDGELVSDLVDLWRRRPGDEAFVPWVSALAARLLKGGGFEDIRARQAGPGSPAPWPQRRANWTTGPTAPPRWPWPPTCSMPTACGNARSSRAA